MKVKKKSGKPFKSGLKINTVKDVVKHPILGTEAFSFEEDDSIVEIKICLPKDMALEGMSEEDLMKEIEAL